MRERTFSHVRAVSYPGEVRSRSSSIWEIRGEIGGVTHRSRTHCIARRFCKKYLNFFDVTSMEWLIVFRNDYDLVVPFVTVTSTRKQLNREARTQRTRPFPVIDFRRITFIMTNYRRGWRSFVLRVVWGEQLNDSSISWCPSTIPLCRIKRNKAREWEQHRKGEKRESERGKDEWIEKSKSRAMDRQNELGADCQTWNGANEVRMVLNTKYHRVGGTHRAIASSKHIAQVIPGIPEWLVSPALLLELTYCDYIFLHSHTK